MSNDLDPDQPRFLVSDLGQTVCTWQVPTRENGISQGTSATFTRVNGTVSCFCNKRLQNWPTVYTNFSRWPVLWFINSISYEKCSLKQWYMYVTSRSGSSIILFVFSDSAVFGNVSSAIRNYGGLVFPPAPKKGTVKFPGKGHLKRVTTG